MPLHGNHNYPGVPSPICSLKEEPPDTIISDDMGGQSREGTRTSALSHLSTLTIILGGKVKPLKAPKKDKKDVDDDEMAYKQKKAAGTPTMQ